MADVGKSQHLRFVFPEDEAHSAYRVQELFLEIAIQFTPQPRDLHIDHVIQWGVTHDLLPDLAREHLSRNNRAAIQAEDIRAGRIPARSTQVFLPPRVAVRPSNSRVRSAMRNDEAAGGRLRAHESANARKQLSKRKRLYQVVIGARVQAEHAVLDGVSRGKNQNRTLKTSSSHIAQHFQAAPRRKHQVEKNKVEVKTAYGGERVFSSGRKGYRVTLPLQPLGNCVRQLTFVFNQQDVQEPALTLPKNVQASRPCAPGVKGKCQENVRFL